MCCVTGCKSNYLSEKEKVTVYQPSSDPEEGRWWIKAIARDNIPDSPIIVVCVEHILPGFPVLKIKGKPRPSDPPSAFENIPKA